MSTHCADLITFDAQYNAGVLCGIDEAGRGPWAGPVVAAAAIWPHAQFVPPALNDSKKLSAKKRETLYPHIMEHAITGIGIASVEEIDQLNILAASLLAMRRAYNALGTQADLALIDGNKLPDLPCRAEYVVKGDARSACIAAASVVAKVTRDNIMCELSQEHPEYGFDQHAGYGTKQHQQALASFGATPHHRRSFAPIRKLLAQEQAA